MKILSRWNNLAVIACLLELNVVAAPGERAAAPELTYPTTADKVFQTIPYFDWKDVVSHPYPGSYEIQIFAGEKLVDADTLPAFISYYSPNFELAVGQSYHWRVRHVSPDGKPGDWSASSGFAISRPAHIVDVNGSDGWSEIQRKLQEASSQGSEGGALLRFPEKHTFQLQQAGGDYLFELNRARNLIIDGRGSKLMLQAKPLEDTKRTTRSVEKFGRIKVKTTERSCGFFTASDSSHIQIKNFVLDYAADSLMQFGGKITSLDKKTRVLEIEVDPNVYQNVHEVKHEKEMFFLTGEHRQRIGYKGVGYSAEQTWGEASIGDNKFRFTMSKGEWERYEAELKVGDYAVTGLRGGDVFTAFKGDSDIVLNNCRTQASRSRYFIVRGGNFMRCIGNQFLRTSGRIMGCPSGGVNDHGNCDWYADTIFQDTRDDAFHSGESEGQLLQQIVLRNCKFESAFRHSIWVQSDRTWIEGNVVKYAAGPAITLGAYGLNSDQATLVNVGLVRSNLSIEANSGCVTAATSPQKPDSATGKYNQFITVVENVAVDDHGGYGFSLSCLKDSIVSSNRVENAKETGWRVYSEEEKHGGFFFDNCCNVQGSGNSVTDQRIVPQQWLVKDKSLTNVNVSVDGQSPSH